MTVGFFKDPGVVVYQAIQKDRGKALICSNYSKGDSCQGFKMVAGSHMTYASF